MRRISVLTVALMLLAACGDGAATTAAPKPYRVLVFTKTTGFRHTSIDEGAGAIRALGHDHGFSVDTTADAARFTRSRLDRYDAVVFLSTTGTPIAKPAQRRAFERYIRAGGGYVGIHAASDTRGSWPWYERLVGARFKHHAAGHAEQDRDGRGPHLRGDAHRCPRTGHAPTSGTSSAPIHARACTCWRASRDVRSRGVSATTEAGPCTRQWDIRRPRSVSRTTSHTCSARSRWPLGARGSTVRLSAAAAARGADPRRLRLRETG